MFSFTCAIGTFVHFTPATYLDFPHLAPIRIVDRAMKPCHVCYRDDGSMGNTQTRVLRMDAQHTGINTGFATLTRPPLTMRRFAILQQAHVDAYMHYFIQRRPDLSKILQNEWPDYSLHIPTLHCNAPLDTFDQDRRLGDHRRQHALRSVDGYHFEGVGTSCDNPHNVSHTKVSDVCHASIYLATNRMCATCFPFVSLLSP